MGLIDDTRRIALHPTAAGDIFCNESPRFHCAIIADCYARKDDRTHADDSSRADDRIEVKPARHVMRQHHRLFVDDAILADMDTPWPSAINQG